MQVRSRKIGSSKVKLA